MNPCLVVLAAGLLYLAIAEAGEFGETSFSAVAKRVRRQAEAATTRVMAAYTNAIPGSKASYAMLPISGGEFVMGSSSEDRLAGVDERPAHRVKLEPFWLGKCEVTWDEYNAFVQDDIERRQSSPPPISPAFDPGLADAITHPSLPYVDMDFGMGKRGYPAIAMTQHAANKYCQWLSAKTGHFYRLPTEAEWEYAARAGTTNTWYFGEDGSKLGGYAWFEANSADQYRKVGRKLPSAWGLHDMLGNVSEWVLDQYDGGFYRFCAEQGTVNLPWK